MLTKEDLQAIAGLLEPIHERFDKLETRFDKLEDKVDNLEVRFDALETRFDNLEGRFDVLETRFDKLETRFDKLETRFDKLETRFDDLEDKVDVLEGYVNAHRADFAQYHKRTLPLVNHLTENWLDFAARAKEFDAVKLQLEDHDMRLSVIEDSIRKAQ